MCMNERSCLILARSLLIVLSCSLCCLLRVVFVFVPQLTSVQICPTPHSNPNNKSLHLSVRPSRAYLQLFPCPPIHRPSMRGSGNNASLACRSVPRTVRKGRVYCLDSGRVSLHRALHPFRLFVEIRIRTHPRARALHPSIRHSLVPSRCPPFHVVPLHAYVRKWKFAVLQVASCTWWTVRERLINQLGVV